MLISGHDVVQCTDWSGLTELLKNNEGITPSAV